jgi:hypothetical protein
LRYFSTADKYILQQQKNITEKCKKLARDQKIFFFILIRLIFAEAKRIGELFTHLSFQALSPNVELCFHVYPIVMNKNDEFEGH